MPIVEVQVEFLFSCAHRLPYYDGPCFHLHGHNYKVLVTVAGPPDPRDGMVIDFEILKKVVWEKALSKVDHKYLNDFMDNPTAEHIVVWMWGELKEALPGLRELKLFETPEYCVTYRGEGHDT